MSNNNRPAWAQGARMTIRQAFEALYGPIPEGATCHIGTCRCYGGTTTPAIYNDGRISVAYTDRWETIRLHDIESPDISDRPAYEFRGFFGTEFDELVGDGWYPIETAPKGFVWTKEPPTEPGAYLVRYKAPRQRKWRKAVADVAYLSGVLWIWPSMEMIPHMSTFDGPLSRLAQTIKTIEWAGPIPEPEEANND